MREFTIHAGKYYRLKKNKIYPCRSRAFPNGIDMYTDDVLTKEPDGTWRKHTGISLGGIVIPDEDVELSTKDANLVML